MEKDHIVLVVGVDREYAIGKNGSLPWKIPNDMKLFRHITKNNPVIMGRKTWQSLPKPLTQRTNIIISKSIKQKSLNNLENSHPIFVVPSPKHAIEKARESMALHNNNNHKPSIMIIGGSEIFKSFADQANEIFISHLDIKVDNPDSFFDQAWIKKNHYKKIKSRRHSASQTENDLVNFTLEQYVRINNHFSCEVNSVFSLDLFTEKDLNNNDNVETNSDRQVVDA